MHSQWTPIQYLPVALWVFLDLIVSFVYQKPLFSPTVKCFTLAHRNEQIEMLKFPLKIKKKPSNKQMKTPRELEILCVCAHFHKCTNSLACKEYMFTYDQKLTWSAFFNCSWLSSSVPASLSIWLAPGIRCVWALGSHTAVNPSWRLHDCRESELLASCLYSKPFAYWPSLQLPWQSKQIFGDTGLEPKLVSWLTSGNSRSFWKY